MQNIYRYNYVNITSVFKSEGTINIINKMSSTSATRAKTVSYNTMKKVKWNGTEGVSLYVSFKKFHQSQTT